MAEDHDSSGKDSAENRITDAERKKPVRKESSSRPKAGAVKDPGEGREHSLSPDRKSLFEYRINRRVGVRRKRRVEDRRKHRVEVADNMDRRIGDRRKRHIEDNENEDRRAEDRRKHAAERYLRVTGFYDRLEGRYCIKKELFREALKHKKGDSVLDTVPPPKPKGDGE